MSIVEDRQVDVWRSVTSRLTDCDSHFRYSFLPADSFTPFRSHLIDEQGRHRGIAGRECEDARNLAVSDPSTSNIDWLQKMNPDLPDWEMHSPAPWGFRHNKSETYIIDII